MKKIITLFVLFLSIGIANAQTEAETLEWLNTKKAEAQYINSTTVTSNYGGKLEITNEILHVYNDEGAYTKINWNEIKDIKQQNKDILIISNSMYNGKNSNISFYISNEELRPKYLKALKHMATLKGAKLVNDDLF
ncbi:hypothetical protein HXZ94_01475 [Empedobacter falsenii]|uniref:hypothetical protein n=1 Tax=Empedobacter falsenii TaxID=343874 RepID=UPI002578E073|nr:hypothetical protein [Empedobacter falsenii]MDM1297178.1 hypothetical protein [Empedobacter falsenii]MDM1316971.1 hypothetical protein [Empedobacter falsenii]